MVYYKSDEQIELIRISGDVLGRAHAEVAKAVKPGVTTALLDKIAFDYITDHNGLPSFKGYMGFPATLCISVNEQVVHGFPSNYILKDGDIVSVDCGVKLNGFHSDSAYTYGVGETTEEVKLFLSRTKESLYKAIAVAHAGNRIGDIGFAVQSHVEAFDYSVVRELVGHGIGKDLHEGPEVPNYGKRGKGLKLQNGLVIAIEPMVNMGKRNVLQEKDGWTIRTVDRQYSAHFEHTVAIKGDEPLVLTTFKYIEEVLN